MIERLKLLIDQCENKPKLKEILLAVAAMPEDKQEDTLEFIHALAVNECLNRRLNK